MPTSLALRTILPERLAADVRRLGERHGIRNIRVFGSFARGEAAPESDLDFLVEYIPGHGGFAFVDFCDQVEELVGRKVDVVTEKSLPPLTRERVMAQAIPL